MSNKWIFKRGRQDGRKRERETGGLKGVGRCFMMTHVWLVGSSSLFSDFVNNLYL